MTESSTQVGQIEAIDTIGTGLKKITLSLDVDKPLRFKAGQCLAIPIPDQNKISYFSIASSPTLENKIELIIKEDKQAASPRYLLSLSELFYRKPRNAWIRRGKITQRKPRHSEQDVLARQRRNECRHHFGSIRRRP